MQTILVIDDELSVRQSFQMILSEKYRVLLAENGGAGLKMLQNTHVDLVLLDLLMPGMPGLDTLLEIARLEETVPVVVVTALNSVETAVEAMKRGALEYIIKPFDVDQILVVVERILAEQKNQRELKVLREEEAHDFQSIIGESAALLDVLAHARRAAQVDSTILISGESGTGKDILARAIHSHSKRAREAFVHVSCCAIPAQLVESELFGHERGAFTGAIQKRIGKIQVADRGTVFLDEIGEMPLEAQAKLLRVLQGGQFYSVGSTKVVEVDVRFIGATNRNLQKSILEKSFRQDLFYRINVIPIEMPPLRNRREDIPLLLTHFLAKHGPRVNARCKHFAPDTLAKLAAYSWPGNVRELENAMQRILVYHQDEEIIRPEHLAGALGIDRTTADNDAVSFSEFQGLPLEEATERLQRHLIKRALARCGHIQSRAAELLGTTRRILKYKMDQLGIAAICSNETEQVRKAG